MLYEDKFGNIMMEEDVSKLSSMDIQELGIHPSDIDEGEFSD